MGDGILDLFLVKYFSDVLDVKQIWKNFSLGKIAIIIWKIDHKGDISDNMC